jgi:uridine phosphorylase
MSADFNIPLLENDLDQPAVFDATTIHRPIDIPSVAVLCFFYDVLERLASNEVLKVVYKIRSELGLNPVYQIDFEGQLVNVVHPGVGAPLAAAFTDELVALGVRTFVAVGGAGALIDDLALGHVMVVDSALRDEGTSFHYAAPSRTIDADPKGVAVLERVLNAEGIGFFRGRTWTTDGLFREARTRVERRINEGCSMVDMESSAFMAVAKYRGLDFAQFLYAGDSLAGETWDERSWQSANDVREKLFYVAVRAVVELSKAS